MKLLIAGGRDFNDEALLRDRLQQLVTDGLIDESVELVCGMARGADMLGHRVFKMNNLPIHGYPAVWEGLGKRAGFVRNAEMGNECDLALTFWDGRSKGTKHMIDYLNKLNKRAFVVNY